MPLSPSPEIRNLVDAWLIISSTRPTSEFYSPPFLAVVVGISFMLTAEHIRSNIKCCFENVLLWARNWCQQIVLVFVGFFFSRQNGPRDRKRLLWSKVYQTLIGFGLVCETLPWPAKILQFTLPPKSDHLRLGTSLQCTLLCQRNLPPHCPRIQIRSYRLNFLYLNL